MLADDLVEGDLGARELLHLDQAGGQVEAVSGQLGLDRDGLLEMGQRLGGLVAADVDVAE